jgi:hypothetical protein
MNISDKFQICHLFYPSFSFQSSVFQFNPCSRRNIQLDTNLGSKNLIVQNKNLIIKLIFLKIITLIQWYVI